MPSPGPQCSASACRSTSVGLITLDAHFDMRDLDQGLSNGNPVRALIEDGLPGANIAQVGLASFANSRADARGRGRGRQPGHHASTTSGATESRTAIDRALDHVAHCDAMVIDCDIDVIDRSQFPAAPGARPGGMAVARFLLRGAPARIRSARARDRPHRMGPAARHDRPQRFDRGALGRRVPRRLRDALVFGALRSRSQ